MWLSRKKVSTHSINKNIFGNTVNQQKLCDLKDRWGGEGGWGSSCSLDFKCIKTSKGFSIDDKDQALEFLRSGEYLPT
jgi:hypothetical protein